MVFETDVVDHLLQNFLRWLEIVPRPVEWLLTDWLCGLVVQAFEVWMGQTLLHIVSFQWAEVHCLAKQVKCNRVALWEESTPALLVSFGQRLHIFDGQLITDKLQLLRSRSAEDTNHPLDLIQVVVARQQGSAT